MSPIKPLRSVVHVGGSIQFSFGDISAGAFISSLLSYLIRHCLELGNSKPLCLIRGADRKSTCGISRRIYR